MGVQRESVNGAKLLFWRVRSYVQRRGVVLTLGEKRASRAGRALEQQRGHLVDYGGDGGWVESCWLAAISS